MPTLKITLYCLLGCLLLMFIACKATNKSLTQSPTLDTVDTEDTVDAEKIMVLLQNQVRPNALEEEFKAYELKSKGLVSRRENRCMFTYNPSLIEGSKLLAMIQASDKVLEAQFPKIVRKPKVTN